MTKVYLQYGYIPIVVKVIAETEFTYIMKDEKGEEYKGIKGHVYDTLQDALEELESFKHVIGLHIDKINELIKEATEL